jgi:hypothetical protein
MSDPSSNPLRAAAQGFTDLAAWLGELASTHLVDAASAADEGRLDMTSAIARAATLPLIGWVALVNEIVDAATVITLPPQRLRERTSDEHVGLEGWKGKSLAVSDLVNGFGDRLPKGVEVSVEPEKLGTDLAFRLRATKIPHECVGVYSGTARPKGAKRSVPVWLVIP